MFSYGQGTPVHHRKSAAAIPPALSVSLSLGIQPRVGSGDTNPCRMTGVTLHSRIRSPYTGLYPQTFLPPPPALSQCNSRTKIPPPLPPLAHRTVDYRGTSFTGKRTSLGPYRRPMPRVLGGSWGGGRFLMGEVPLKVKTQQSGPFSAEKCSREGDPEPFEPDPQQHSQGYLEHNKTPPPLGPS